MAALMLILGPTAKFSPANLAPNTHIFQSFPFRRAQEGSKGQEANGPPNYWLRGRRTQHPWPSDRESQLLLRLYHHHHHLLVLVLLLLLLMRWWCGVVLLLLLLLSLLPGLVVLAVAAAARCCCQWLVVLLGVLMTHLRLIPPLLLP